MLFILVDVDTECAYEFAKSRHDHEWVGGMMVNAMKRKKTDKNIILW